MIISGAAAKFKDLPLGETLDFFADNGVRGVELATGGFQGAPHVGVEDLLSSESARSRFIAGFERRGLEIVALACHGNPLHPDSKIRDTDRADYVKTLELAESLAVKTVVCLSGCPGSNESAGIASWYPGAWPEESRRVIRWQWEEIALPYWTEAAALAAKHGIRVAVEMHPSNLVYNPATLLRLRSLAGESIGANMDTGHLFWQGIDPAAAAKKLGPAMYHTHIKDVAVDEAVMSVDGCLDGATVFDDIPRSWRFTTPGYSHDEGYWTRFVRTLMAVGYEGALSIEHEDRVMSRDDGFRQSAKMLTKILADTTRYDRIE